MKPPKSLVSGKFSPDDIIVSISPSNRKIDLSVESQLEDIWDKMVAKATAGGKVCYNGMSHRLNSLKQDAKFLTIDFGTIEYKVREGLASIPEYFDLPEDYYRKGCFSTASIKTSDGKYLMIKLSGKSMNEDVTDLVGGIMETDVPLHTGEDIFKSFYKELEEEVGVTRADISDIYLQNIYLGGLTNVGFYFEVLLNVTSDELITRFKNNQDIDIQEIIMYSREEYIHALNTHRSPHKPYIAKLLQI